jgi:hypothetical protein
VAGIGGGNDAIFRDELTLSQLRAYSCVIFHETFKRRVRPAEDATFKIVSACSQSRALLSDPAA